VLCRMLQGRTVALACLPLVLEDAADMIEIDTRYDRASDDNVIKITDGEPSG
jgi:hypothetical protein